MSKKSDAESKAKEEFGKKVAELHEKKMRQMLGNREYAKRKAAPIVQSAIDAKLAREASIIGKTARALGSAVKALTPSALKKSSRGRDDSGRSF